MSPSRNRDSPTPSPASECPPPPNSDDWRKRLALCLLCACFLSSGMHNLARGFRNTMLPDNPIMDEI